MIRYRVKHKAFFDNSLKEPGCIITLKNPFKEVPKWCEVINEGGAEVLLPPPEVPLYKDVDDMKVDEIKANLVGLGIEFDPNLKKPELKALLIEHQDPPKGVTQDNNIVETL